MRIKELFNDIEVNAEDVIPFGVQQLLRQELVDDGDWSKAESLLLDTLTALPGRIEIRVALYKLYAYGCRFEEALSQINRVFTCIAEQYALPEKWCDIKGSSHNWQLAEGELRLYLYTMKAHGFVSLRMGEVQTALAVLNKLRELDPLDRVGGSVVCEMAERLVDEER